MPSIFYWTLTDYYTSYPIFASISKDRNIMIQRSGYRPNMTKEEKDNYYADIVSNMSFDDVYELEISNDYLHFSGAVSFTHYNNRELGYTNKPVGTFFIVANTGIDDTTLELMDELSGRYMER